MHRLWHLSTIIADLGDIFVFIAPITCVPLIVAVIFSEWNMLLPMLAVPLTFYIMGMLIKKLPRADRVVRLSTALCSVALFWFTSALVSGLPFMLGLHMGFTDALFEGMAGWTGTAFSMMQSLETAPPYSSLLAILYAVDQRDWDYLICDCNGQQHRPYPVKDLPYGP